MFSFQTHPNVDKKLFTAESQIGLKNPEKSFPINSDVGVLKWRLQTTEESFIPLTSECAPASGVSCGTGWCVSAAGLSGLMPASGVWHPRGCWGCCVSSLG